MEDENRYLWPDFHAKSRANHPQTNGKFEKWSDIYEKNRFRFENFNNLMNSHNDMRYHESLEMDQGAAKLAKGV